MAIKGGQLMVLAIIALMLVLLAAVIFGTGGIEFLGPGKVYNGRDVLYVGNVGAIGESEGGTFRHIPLGNVRIGLSLDNGPLESEEGPVSVSRGVLTADDHMMNIPQGELRGAGLLRFRVIDANGQGTLMVWVNDAVVWSGRPKAGEEPEIRVRPEGRGSARIRLSVTSSGWMVWSPSVYVIGNVRVSEEGQRQQRRGFNFEVGKEEVDGWSLGRIVFRIAEASQPAKPDLLVKVNNATVFAGKPAKGSLPVIVDFGKAATAIREGNNTISFEVGGEGSYDIDDVEAIIFTNMEGRREPSFRFELTQEDVDGLQEGRLNGIVTFKVTTPGSLSVSVRDAEGGEKVLLRETQKGAGMIDLPFGWQHVSAGANGLQFNSTWSAAIENLRVRLYK